MAENSPSARPKTDLAKREEETLAFWRDRSIFQKTLDKKAPNGDFVFYDGPPFATGLPHYGHILAGTIKDAIPRYKTMRGFRVPRRWGWDCHGLPIENEIEKQLGLKTKKDIEELGIEKFNDAASNAVLRYAEDWKNIVPRTGRFVDMENDYRTMDSSYTESIWWGFKKLWGDKLVYKGFKSMHLCPRCGTTLSNFEVNQGYKDITDLSVTVKFKVKKPEKIGLSGDVYLLAWTTTPWTLPGNMALAVLDAVDPLKEVERYVSWHENNSTVISSARFFRQLGKKDSEIIHLFGSSDLVGLEYEPPYDYYAAADIQNKENAWKVYAASFVATDEGTGIVHIAPAFGDDDLALAQRERIPVVHHVAETGVFKPEIAAFAGMPVKPKDDKERGVDHQDADVAVIKDLAHRGLLFAKEKLTHSYPHCWRCDTPLLNYAASSWFLKVASWKDKLAAANEKVRWVPESIGTYRFGNWLAEARDWAISRSRYWGAPLPVWGCAQCDEETVVGSLKELKEKTKRSGNRYFVVRHGQASHMLTDVYTTDPKGESGLTELGKEQVAGAADAIPRSGPIILLSSPIRRARESADILAEKLGVAKENIIVDERLREISFGEFDGRSKFDYYAFLERPDWYTARPAGGESLEDVKVRFGRALYDYESRYADSTVVIVTHAVAFTALSAVLEGARGSTLLNTTRALVSPGTVEELPFVPLPVNEKFEIDFHRPYIDSIRLVCGSCGAPVERIPDVFDCWYESGSMPYAQQHYLGEGTKDFDPARGAGYPADFIAEGLDQTRGWFYSLLVLNMALFGEAPYRHVIVNGIIRAEDGQKMSKRLKNYPDPLDVISTYGADSIRYYLLSSPVVRGEDINFSEQGVGEVSKKIIMRLANVRSFLDLYAADGTKLSSKELRAQTAARANPLDRWILSRLGETVRAVTDGFESYELDRATRPIGSFIDDLSTWYVRRSRDRFRDPSSGDYGHARAALQFVLVELAKILAPVMPFFAEELYQGVKPADGKESVHLEEWPDDLGVDETILKEMAEVRRISSQALEIRSRDTIRVRQPLSKLTAISALLAESPYRDALEVLVEEEVNVKNAVFFPGDSNEVMLDTALTDELREEGVLRDVVRAIQEWRKQNGFSMSDTPTLAVEVDAAGEAFFKKFSGSIVEQTGLAKLERTVSATEGGAPGFPFSVSFLPAKRL